MQGDDGFEAAGTAAAAAAAGGSGQQQQPQQQQSSHYNTVMPLAPYAMRAGPRENIYFDPAMVTAAIVTTGDAKGSS